MPEASVTVTVFVTVDVAAPPPSLTQMIMTSSTELADDFEYPELLLSLLLLFPLSTETSTPWFDMRGAGWLMAPANTKGAAHNAVTVENLMMKYITRWLEKGS